MTPTTETTAPLKITGFDDNGRIMNSSVTVGRLNGDNHYSGDAMFWGRPIAEALRKANEYIDRETARVEASHV